MKKEYDFTRARRGAVVRPGANKTRITIRLDNDILEWFRAQADSRAGGNYQTMINHALRQHIEHYDGRLETMLRKVVREEIRKAS